MNNLKSYLLYGPCRLCDMLSVHVLDYNSNHCNGPGVDWLLERTVDTGMNGVSSGPHSFSDLDFADVALLAELLVMQNLDNHSAKLKLYNTCMAVSSGLS